MADETRSKYERITGIYAAIHGMEKIKNFNHRNNIKKEYGVKIESFINRRLTGE